LVVLIPFWLLIEIPPPHCTPNSLGIRTELVGLELVYIYKDGVWVEFVYRNQQNNIVGETLLDLVWLEPSSFEFFVVNSFGLQKPTKHGHQRQMIFVCNVGAPILPGWIIVSLLSQQQPNEIPSAFLNWLFN
jgi:hypothetical protein